MAHRGVLDSSLAEIGRHLGGLDVLSNVANAEVLVDGHVRGRTPLARPIRVEAGTLNVEVRAEGHTAVRRTVEVTGGASAPARVSVDLVATAVTPTVAPPTRAVLRTTEPAPTPPVGPRGSTQRTLAWAGAIGAAVFVGTGVVAYVVGSGAAADWNDDTMCLQTTMPTVTRGGQCPGVDGTADTMQALSLVGFLGGSALAVASVVLFATAPGSRPREHAARFGCGVGPTALGMACGGTF